MSGLPNVAAQIDLASVRATAPVAAQLPLTNPWLLAWEWALLVVGVTAVLVVGFVGVYLLAWVAFAGPRWLWERLWRPRRRGK